MWLATAAGVVVFDVVVALDTRDLTSGGNIGSVGWLVVACSKRDMSED